MDELDISGVRGTLIRGGTCKGLYLLRQDLPADPDARDRLLLRRPSHDATASASQVASRRGTCS